MTDKILLLTHSSRKTDMEHISLNYLTRRYADPERLDKVPPFETLAQSPIWYSGALSIYKIYENKTNLSFEHLGSAKSIHKIQHAAQVNSNQIIICYESFLELWTFPLPLHRISKSEELDFKVERRFDHPHFAGLHTVFLLDEKKVILSASAPDAVLILNMETGLVESTLRMPEDIYGSNYTIREDMDLRKHYIKNDYQTTHINSAYPSKDGKEVIVSLLIQGAIGVWDLKTGEYKELVRGFVGCHGARFTETGDIYFADSVTGTLVIMNRQGKIKQRFAVYSYWLHDVMQISGDIYAFSISDSNELAIYNIRTSELLHKLKFNTLPDIFFLLQKKLYKVTKNPSFLKLFNLGNSTQFINILPVDEQS